MPGWSLAFQDTRRTMGSPQPALERSEGLQRGMVGGRKPFELVVSHAKLEPGVPRRTVNDGIATLS